MSLLIYGFRGIREIPMSDFQREKIPRVPCAVVAPSARSVSGVDAFRAGEAQNGSGRRSCTCRVLCAGMKKAEPLAAPRSFQFFLSSGAYRREKKAHDETDGPAGFLQDRQQHAAYAVFMAVFVISVLTHFIDCSNYSSSGGTCQQSDNPLFPGSGGVFAAKDVDAAGSSMVRSI